MIGIDTSCKPIEHLASRLFSILDEAICNVEKVSLVRAQCHTEGTLRICNEPSIACLGAGEVVGGDAGLKGR